MPSPALIEKVLKNNDLYKDDQVITEPHVFVFVTNEAGIAGTDSGKIAKRHYKRPMQPITGFHENHMGTTYGICMKKANMVTSLPVADIVHEMMVLYYLADADKGQRRWVLPNFARNVDRSTSEEVVKVIKEFYLNKKELFIIPDSWLYAINPYF
jgi:hypothetical protein